VGGSAGVSVGDGTVLVAVTVGVGVGSVVTTGFVATAVGISAIGVSSGTTADVIVGANSAVVQAAKIRISKNAPAKLNPFLITKSSTHLFHGFSPRSG
jgi:hypothetical protein